MADEVKYEGVLFAREEHMAEPTFEERYGPWICMGCGHSHKEGDPCPTEPKGIVAEAEEMTDEDKKARLLRADARHYRAQQRAAEDRLAELVQAMEKIANWPASYPANDNIQRIREYAAAAVEKVKK